MKRFLAITPLVAAALLLLNGCQKKLDALSYYNAGSPVTLTASKTTVAASPSDSLSKVLAFSWTSPNYGVDPNTYKYVIEMDSAGKNFSNPTRRTVTGKLNDSVTAKELNNMLLGYGYAIGVPVDMDVRLVSSYANNNERLTSNTVRIKMTPYKVPPKVALPTSGKLFLVGDATAGGWNNPVPTPTQEFSRLDETTWAGIFNLVGGKQYLMLPVNGDWSNKYSVASNSLPGLNAGGNFGYNLSDNLPGPAASGWYKIMVDFQQGKFTVTPYAGTLPTNLFIVGDASAGGWNNPVPVPSQQLTRQNSSEWKITLPLTGGKEYLLLPVNGDWSHKYSVPDKSLAGLRSGGSFGYDLGDNFPGPTTSGTYTLTVNFAAGGNTNTSAGKFTVQ